MAASEALSGGAPGGPAQVWVEAHAAGCGPGRPRALCTRPRALCTQAAGLCTGPRALCTQAVDLVARHHGLAGTVGAPLRLLPGRAQAVRGLRGGG